MKKYFFTLVTVITTLVVGYSQNWPADTINTRINSGDPKFPFPQFLEYTAGKSLAAYNAEGVTHADMEKTMLEGYQIMMHRCLYVPGKVLNGKKYIVYNHSTVPHNYNTFVSEGDGYALQAAAYFADKEAFDGLWLWIHDNRMSKVKKYSDCQDLRPNYPHGPNLACWKCDETTDAGSTDANSATDGDYDIAMGLLLAYAQWGNNMGINDACGNPISYREEALKVIKALVDTVDYTKAAGGAAAGVRGYLTGDIGIDGYCKNGNTWNEITSWRTSAANTNYAWARAKPDPLSITDLYTDYIGPAYFNQFSKFLTNNGGTPWQINQFKRGEASSDWLIGQMYAKGYIASSGQCTVSNDGSVTTFGQHPSGPDGEDFRAAWRTILNYVWHGNPTTKWDPVTHEVVSGGNTYELDMGKRHADFLKFPRTLPSDNTAAECQVMGASPDPSCPLYKGVANIKQSHSVTGAPYRGNYRTNYNVGTGAAAAVASEDTELIAEIYRQSELLWDGSDTRMFLTEEERYIKSTPKYFHDWFRVLGMLTTSGNLHPYGTMTPAANMKVYLSVDKTYAYSGDQITYTVSYRNYGSVAATGVNIKTELDTDYTFVSAQNGTLSGSTISFNIGTVPGFKSSTGIAPTQGTVSFTVKVKNPSAQKRACLTSTVTASNAPTWKSNEYPNNASYTMERNCVDLLPERALKITKTTDRAAMNPGDIANFKLEFENTSSAGLILNGGRNKVVMSYGNFLADRTFFQYYRFWHTAEEAYVNLHNYRVSYYMNDAAAIGLYDAATNPTGWDYTINNEEDMNKYLYNPTTLPPDQRISFSHQTIPFGSNSEGSWNQRIIVRFANVLTSPTTHIYDKLDNRYLIHKGAIGPAFFRTRLESKPSSILAPRLEDDWSYSKSIDINDPSGGQSKRLTPITNNWADPENPDLPVTTYSKDACESNVPNYKKLLVEEFDGFTWRRLAGTSPLPGREAYNVEVIDTIPKELSWDSFTDADALGVTATYTPAAAGAAYTGIVKWTIPVMLTGAKGDLGYKVIARANPPCPAPDKVFVNIGYIKSQTDSPDTSLVNLKITCNAVPPTAPAETSLKKTADKTNVEVGDVVTYSIKYKNTKGSIVSWVTNTASDWQVLGTGTTMPDMNKPSISLDQNDNTFKPGPNGYAFGHKKSHGVNGFVEATVDPTNSSPVSFIFRHSGGTPGQTNFQGVELRITPNPGGPNTVNFSIYNNGTLLPTLIGISYGGSADPINFKAELVDDKLYIWVNNFTGAPLKVVSGITQKAPGYVGIFTGGAQQIITGWKTHFDSSFDLSVTDPVPTQLGNVTAISNSGTLSAGTVAWPLVPGPILATDSIIYTFKATVNECSNFITNIAQANIYGVSDIASQYVVSCGPTACTPPAITSAAAGTVCTSTPLTYNITSSINTSTFTWSRAAVPGISNAAVSGQTTNTIQENLVNASTLPIVVRYRIVAKADTCSSAPFNYDVTVNPAPQITSSASGGSCSGAAQNYSISSNYPLATYSWSRAAVAGISNPAVEGQTTNTITETLINTGTAPATVRYVITPNAEGCNGLPFNYDVTVTSSLEITSAATANACSGAPVGYKITSNISTATFNWARSAVDGISNASIAGQTSDSINEILINTGSSPVTVRYTINAAATGCAGSADLNLDVTVNPSPFITGAATGSICSGEAQRYDITSNLSNAAFTWSRAAVAGISNAAVTAQTTDPITETLVNNSTDIAVARYVIVPGVPGCSGTPFSYDVTVSPASAITTQPVSISSCAGSPATLSVAASGLDVTYQWKFNNTDIPGATGSSYTIPSTSTENAGPYQVVVTSRCVTTTSDIATITLSSAPSNSLAVTGSNVCVGSDGNIKILQAEKDVTYQALLGTLPVGTESVGTGSDLVINIPSSSLNAGSNTISVRATRCSNIVLTNTANIIVTPLPVAYAGADTLLDKYKEITLNGSASSHGAYTYQWTSTDPAAMISSPASISTSVLPKAPSTDFTLTVSDAGNAECASSDVVNVKVKLQSLFVPDAFSPNGDGKHDNYIIPGIESYPKAVLYVYNQWGELIYQSSPGTVFWDGTRNGTPVPVSGYTYILELNDGSKPMAGTITIIK